MTRKLVVRMDFPLFNYFSNTYVKFRKLLERVPRKAESPGSGAQVLQTQRRLYRSSQEDLGAATDKV
jgi:hypothetical protein